MAVSPTDTRMLLPRRWNDPELLQREPFLSEFAVRKSAERRDNRAIDWPSRIAKEVDDNEHARRAALAWLEIVFKPGRRESTNIKSSPVPLDKETCKLFGNVFWSIQDEKEKTALNLIRKARRDRKFIYDFDPVGSGISAGPLAVEEEGDCADGEVPSPTQPRSTKKRAKPKDTRRTKDGQAKKRRKNAPQYAERETASADVSTGIVHATVPVQSNISDIVMTGGTSLGAPLIDATTAPALGIANAARPKRVRRKGKLRNVSIPSVDPPIDHQPISISAVGTIPPQTLAKSPSLPSVAGDTIDVGSVKRRGDDAPTYKGKSKMAKTTTVARSRKAATRKNDSRAARPAHGSLILPPNVLHLRDIEPRLSKAPKHKVKAPAERKPKRHADPQPAAKRQRTERGPLPMPITAPQKSKTLSPAILEGMASVLGVANQSGSPERVFDALSTVPTVFGMSEGPMAPATSSATPPVWTSQPSYLPPSLLSGFDLLKKLNFKRKRDDSADLPPPASREELVPRRKKSLPKRAIFRPVYMLSIGPSGGGTLAENDWALQETAARAYEYHTGRSVSVADVGPDFADARAMFGLENNDDAPGPGVPEWLVQPEKSFASHKIVAPPNRPVLGAERRPPIWAQSRQEVCETLDCFRSYQGGVYFANDHVKGYLLSAFSSSRDAFEHGGRFIISHGGGKSEAIHSKHGRLETHAAGDQLAGDKSVRALLNNFRNNEPLALLADDRYVLFPFDLAADGYTYVVLGMYRITYAWAEPEQTHDGTVIRYKFAFQWCEGQGDPWWCKKLPIDPPQKDASDVIVSRSSPHPEEQAPRRCIPADIPMSSISWMTSQIESLETRPRDSTNSNSTSPAISHLVSALDTTCMQCRSCSRRVYRAGWMCLNPSCVMFWKMDGKGIAATPTDDFDEDFLKLLPQDTPRNQETLYSPLPVASDNGVTVTSQRFAKGMLCDRCGRLSSRFRWQYWQCRNCQIIHEVKGPVRSPKDFWTQQQKLPFYQQLVAADSGIILRPTKFFVANGSHMTCQTYELPNNRGGGFIHIIPGQQRFNEKANNIFREYQEQASSGELDFRRWPMRNHKCRGELLTNYFSQNTGAPYQYVGGAGHTVPMESGASAVCSALDLIKERISSALGRDVPFNEVLSAAYMEKQKMAFHSDSERGLGPVVASLSLGSAALIHFRLHSKYNPNSGNRKPALSIVLRHGDVLVMDGAGIQTYYEHTVVPMNFRMVATARNISPENHTN